MGKLGKFEKESKSLIPLQKLLYIIQVVDLLIVLFTQAANIVPYSDGMREIECYHICRL